MWERNEEQNEEVRRGKKRNDEQMPPIRFSFSSSLITASSWAPDSGDGLYQWLSFSITRRRSVRQTRCRFAFYSVVKKQSTKTLLWNIKKQRQTPVFHFKWNNKQPFPVFPDINLTTPLSSPACRWRWSSRTTTPLPSWRLFTAACWLKSCPCR